MKGFLSWDEDDSAVFSVGEECILLKLIEPVKLVHKEDDFLVLRFLYYVLYLFDAYAYLRLAKHRGASCVFLLASQGWSFPTPLGPQKIRDGTSFLSRSTRRIFPFPRMCSLTHHLVEALRPDPVGKRFSNISFRLYFVSK